jgi:tRNA A37 threonylcarbamoyladenosine modification protein TsaB
MLVCFDVSREGVVALLCAAHVGEWERHEVPTGSGALLRTLATVVKKHGGLKTITGVTVALGQGRFTAVRVAVVTANILAFTLGIPVASSEGVTTVAEAQTLLASPKTKFITPHYNAPARIGGR